MRVEQTMTAPVDLMDPNAMIREAAKKMREDNVGALPVGEDDRLIGMVTDRDIVVRAVADDHAAGTTAVRDVMSEGVLYCYQDDELDRAAELMAKHQIRRLPVINQDKRLVGMLALADIATADQGVAARAVQGVSEPSDDPRSLGAGLGG